MSLKDFLLSFEKILTKMRKTDPSFSEEDLLIKILNNWEESKEKVIEYRKKNIKFFLGT